MRRETISTAFRAGDFISGDAVRGVLRRRRRTQPAARSHAANDLPAVPETAPEDVSSPAAGTGPLRRWSVAELIARAAPPPHADGVSH
jgi:hypothetical protein